MIAVDTPSLASGALAYRMMILERKPWRLSTGPRTGRAVSGNAVTHGLETAAFRAALRYIARIERTVPVQVFAASNQRNAEGYTDPITIRDGRV